MVLWNLFNYSERKTILSDTSFQNVFNNRFWNAMVAQRLMTFNPTGMNGNISIVRFVMTMMKMDPEHREHDNSD